MIKRPLIFLLFLLLQGVCYGQPSELVRIQASLSHIKDSSRYVDALNRVAMLLYEKNVDSTFYYTKKARKISDRLGYDRGEADALNNLGIVFDIKGNLQLALRYYDQAYDGYTALHDSANCVEALMNIAMVYKEMGKDQRGIQHFRLALGIGSKLRKDSIMALAIYDYVLEYPAQFARDSMNYYIAKAKGIATKYKDERTLVGIDQLVADNMIAHGNREQGLALLERTIATAVGKKLFYESMDIVIDMGDQLSASDPERAAGYYRQGLATAVKNGFLIYSQMMARKLFDFYTARGDSLMAAGYSRQLVKLYDDQEKLENGSGIDYLDYALKDQQVKSLQLRSNYETALLVVAAIAVLLATSIIIVIRHNLKRIKELNGQVTDRNEQMTMALGALEQSQADNTRMMKIAAHDLRNPIGGIYSVASMMLDEEERSEEDRVALELIKASSQNSLELVSDLLQVQFKTEALQKEPIDIGELLQYCVSLLLNKAEAKGQQINLHAETFTVPASREKLWRVISNLLANAIKFSPQGGLIDVKMEHDAHRVLIAIKDNGIGIPADMRNKIFDLFTEAKRPGTAGEQPFGLGLAISKQIVEAHGGKIWFESNQGKGTTFFVELPIDIG